MMYTKLISKIHIVRVTDADVNYKGSITICSKIMDSVGLKEYDMVHVNCIESGKHWETYVIRGGDGEICLNGAAANHFNVGDRIHILQYGITEDADYNPKVVYCDENNIIKGIDV